MYNSDFIGYLANNANVDINILTDLFNKTTDVFIVANELITKHGVDGEKLGKTWGDYLGFAYVDPNKSIVNREYLNRIGINFIKMNKVIPLYQLGKAITVATAYPENSSIKIHMQKKLDEVVNFVFCFPFDIKKYLEANNLG